MTTPKRRFLSFVFTVLCLKILNSYYSFTIEMRVAECSRLYFRGVLVQPIVSFARLPYISILFPILGDQTDNLVKRTLVPIY